MNKYGWDCWQEGTSPLLLLSSKRMKRDLIAACPPCPGVSGYRLILSWPHCPVSISRLCVIQRLVCSPVNTVQLTTQKDYVLYLRSGTVSTIIETYTNALHVLLCTKGKNCYSYTYRFHSFRYQRNFLVIIILSSVTLRDQIYGCPSVTWQPSSWVEPRLHSNALKSFSWTVLRKPTRGRFQRFKILLVERRGTCRHPGFSQSSGFRKKKAWESRSAFLDMR